MGVRALTVMGVWLIFLERLRATFCEKAVQSKLQEASCCEIE
jgi:hypothetical protein